MRSIQLEKTHVLDFLLTYLHSCLVARPSLTIVLLFCIWLNYNLQAPTLGQSRKTLDSGHIIA